MRALFIQHDHVSPPSLIGEAFQSHGFDILTHQVVSAERFSRPDVITRFPDLADLDVIIPMGAPWSVYDAERIGSWVHPELDYLRAADAAAIPVFGICFGGQLLATAFGGHVARSAVPEIGYTQVESREPGLVPGGEWFQWHYDSWSLPPGARELASNAAASQAFVLRTNLAVQFHPELDVAMLRLWLDAGGVQEARNAGVDPDQLIQDAIERQAQGAVRAQALVDAFLATVAG